MVIKKLLLVVVGFCATAQCMDMSPLPPASYYAVVDGFDPEIEGFPVRQLPQADSAADNHKRPRTPSDLAMLQSAKKVELSRELDDDVETSDESGTASDYSENGPQKPQPRVKRSQPRRAIAPAVRDAALQYRADNPNTRSYGLKEFKHVFKWKEVVKDSRYKVHFAGAICLICGLAFQRSGAGPEACILRDHLEGARCKKLAGDLVTKESVKALSVDKALSFFTLSGKSARCTRCSAELNILSGNKITRMRLHLLTQICRSKGPLDG